MTNYFDSGGQQVRLGKEIGKGGEGTIFELAGNPRFVAKIYLRPVDLEKKEKLRRMSGTFGAGIMKFAAFPVTTLATSPGGPIVGLVMPRVHGHTEIHNLYSPAHRKLKFPEKDWSFLVHVAMNCAASFDALHQESIVIGDVNQGNLLVSQQGTVFLIDCDSFQFRAQGKFFPCEVGVPHFTPPELQGCSFRDMERTTNHDLFGLAVVVFHLLCMGRHPYAGRFLGEGEMPIEKAISEFRYAYGRMSPMLKMAPPPQTLDLSFTMPRIAALFERAFDRGSEQQDRRPKATEWHAELLELRNLLRACPRDVGHKYPNTLSECLWCRLQREGAPNFFISVSAKAFTTGNLQLTFDVSAIWTQIESVTAPPQVGRVQSDVTRTVLAAFAQKPIVPADLPAEMQQFLGFCRAIGFVAAASAVGCVTFFINHFLGLISVAMTGVFSLWWLFLVFSTGIGQEKHRRQHQLTTADSELVFLKKHLATGLNAAHDEFQRVKRKLQETKVQLTELKQRFDKELHQLRDQRERAQKDAYLQTIFIGDHKIESIGPGRLSQLSSYGIETAYDLDFNRVHNISGFGHTITANLMAWKNEIESKFRFDPSQAVSPSEVQGLVMKSMQLKQHLMSVMEDGLVRLKAIRQDSLHITEVFQSQYAVAYGKQVQAKADLKAFD